MLLAAMLVGGGAFGGWAATSNHYDAIISDMKKHTADESAATARRNLAEVSETANHISQLEVQHEIANRAINTLLDHPDPRVQMPRCARATIATVPTQASGVPVSAPSPNGTDNAAQIALEEFERGLESDAGEWGRALAACQVMQGYIAGLH
jgi:hypothetical protein